MYYIIYVVRQTVSEQIDDDDDDDDDDDVIQQINITVQIHWEKYQVGLL